MLKYQEQLADEYKYKPIPRTFFKDVRAEVEEALPEWCNMSGDTTKLETRSGTVIASGYNRSFQRKLMPDYHDEHCAFDSKPIKRTQWVRFLGKD